MFNSIFRKLFWKEFRTLWPLWMAVAMLCMFIHLGVFLGWDEPGQVSTRNYWIFLTAAMLPALYALGSAGTQFAWELDTGTFYRLRMLPVSSGQVVWAKLAWTITSTVVLAASLWGVSYLWTGGVGVPTKTALGFLNSYTSFILEAILWGAAISMLSRSPLMATILAAISGYFVYSFVMVFSSQVRLNSAQELYFAIWPFRLVVLIPLTWAVIYLGRNWFEHWRQKESLGHETEDWFVAESRMPTIYINGDGGFMALCQQYLKRNIKIWLITGFLTVVVTFISIFSVVKTSDITDVIGFIIWGLGFGCVLVASNVFGSDQSDKGFRFFANHAVATRSVWLSRVLLSGIFFAVPWCIGVAIAWFGIVEEDPIHGRAMVLDIGLALGPCLFMVGAFFSIICISRVLAWVWTLSLSIGCWILANFLWDYQVSILLMLVPALGFMLSSYVALSNKIHDRTGFRIWLKKLSPLAVCMAIFLGLVIVQRIESVPDVEIDPAWVADYEQAWKLPESARLLGELQSLENFEAKRVKLDRSTVWLKPGGQIAVPSEFGDFKSIFNEADLNKLLRIANSSKEPDWSQLIDWNSSDAKRKTVEHLTRLRYGLFDTAEYYSRMGKPEKSLECLLAAIRLSPPWDKASTATIVFDFMPQWSIGPGVSPELVREAIKRIKMVSCPSLGMQRIYLAQYFQTQETLNDMELMEDRMGTAHRMFFTFLPWEHARAIRLSKLSATHDIEWISLHEELYLGNDEPHFQEIQREYSTIEQLLERAKDGPLSRIANSYATPLWQYYQGHDSHAFWSMELFRRLALTSLAIREYQLKHDGALPKTLYEATEQLFSACLMTMPKGAAFGFRAEGIGEKICLQPGFHFTSHKRSALIENRSLEGVPCLVLDKKALTTYQALNTFSEADDDRLLNLQHQIFNSLPAVYPLPFGEKKHEDEKKED